MLKRKKSYGDDLEWVGAVSGILCILVAAVTIGVTCATVLSGPVHHSNLAIVASGNVTAVSRAENATGNAWTYGVTIQVNGTETVSWTETLAEQEPPCIPGDHAWFVIVTNANQLPSDLSCWFSKGGSAVLDDSRETRLIPALAAVNQKASAWSAALPGKHDAIWASAAVAAAECVAICCAISRRVLYERVPDPACRSCGLAIRDAKNARYCPACGKGLGDQDAINAGGDSRYDS